MELISYEKENCEKPGSPVFSQCSSFVQDIKPGNSTANDTYCSSHSYRHPYPSYTMQ